MKPITLNAERAAVAWLNAFLATGQDDARPAMHRTIAVEFFRKGIQFVAVDGTMLFRTWAPTREGAAMPLLEEDPNRTVIVLDREHFAKGFVQTMLTVAREGENEGATVSFAIEPAPTRAAEGELLGESFSADVLVLRAFGQRLHCAIYEGAFPDWRKLQFGIEAIEQVEGMKLATRLFATVGKIKGVLGIDCDFRGEDRAIDIHAVGEKAELRGLLMPMRREKATQVDGSPIGGAD